MPPIWRDQTQIREENHIDVIFLALPRYSYIFLLVADTHPPDLKSAQSGFESQWGHWKGLLRSYFPPGWWGRLSMFTQCTTFIFFGFRTS
jgi:hypothetical protein